MKKLLPVFAVLLLTLLASCQVRVVDEQKPYRDNSLQLYQKYTVQTNDAKIVKMELLKIDNEKLYGKTKTGEEVVINKSDIREIKKPDLLLSLLIGAAALAAVIFVPI